MPNQTPEDPNLPILLDEEPLAVTQARLQGRADLELAAARRKHAPPSKRTSLAAMIVLASVAVLAGGELLATYRQHQQAATFADWQRAAEKVRELRTQREPIVFAPAWAAPMGRAALGAELSLEQAALSDVDRYDRVIEVSTRGARHPWLAAFPLAEPSTFGGVIVALVHKPKATVSFDFTARIREARVQKIVSGGQTTVCTWQSNRFSCDERQTWNWVGPHIAEVGHQPHRCIFAHAVDRAIMRIAFAGVPVGRRLVGYTGIDDFENRKRANFPVRLVVTMGPEQLKVIDHKNLWPWQRFEVDTATHAGETQDIGFEVSTPQAFARTFCFAAEMRK